MILLSPAWTVEGTRELMYISHPFYSCFNSLSGPFRNYACRSCLLKLVLINCILWKVLSAHRKCIIRFLPFWLLWNPSDICSYAMKRALIFASLFLLYKTSILMKKWQQWVFINVMYYRTAFFKILFSKNVSYFLPFVLYIFLLEWSCRANKAALFFIHTLTCCTKKTVSFI